MSIKTSAGGFHLFGTSAPFIRRYAQPGSTELDESKTPLIDLPCLKMVCNAFSKFERVNLNMQKNRLFVVLVCIRLHTVEVTLSDGEKYTSILVPATFRICGTLSAFIEPNLALAGSGRSV